MLLHGYTPTDLLKSSIISKSNDAKVSLSNIDNYRGIALFNCICKLLLLLLIVWLHLIGRQVIRVVTTM